MSYNQFKDVNISSEMYFPCGTESLSIASEQWVDEKIQILLGLIDELDKKISNFNLSNDFIAKSSPISSAAEQMDPISSYGIDNLILRDESTNLVYELVVQNKKLKLVRRGESPYTFSILHDGVWYEMDSLDSALNNAQDGDTVSYNPQDKTALSCEDGFRITKSLILDFNNNEIDYTQGSQGTLSVPSGSLFEIGTVSSDGLSAIPSVTIRNATVVCNGYEGGLYKQNGGCITNQEYTSDAGEVYTSVSSLTLENLRISKFGYGLKLLWDESLSCETKLTVKNCSFTDNIIAGVRVDCISDSSFENCEISGNGVIDKIDRTDVGTESLRSLVGVDVEIQGTTSCDSLTFNNCTFYKNGDLSTLVVGQYSHGSNFLIGSQDTSSYLSAVTFRNCEFTQIETASDNSSPNFGTIGNQGDSSYPKNVTFVSCEFYQTNGDLSGFIIDRRNVYSSIMNRLSSIDNERYSISCAAANSTTYLLSSNYETPQIGPLPIEPTSRFLSTHIDYVCDHSGQTSSEVTLMSAYFCDYNDEYSDVVGSFKQKLSLDNAYVLAIIPKKDCDTLIDTYRNYGPEMYQLQKTLTRNQWTDLSDITDWHFDLECVFDSVNEQHQFESVPLSSFSIYGKLFVLGHWRTQMMQVTEQNLSYNKSEIRIIDDLDMEYTRDDVPQYGQYHPTFGYLRDSATANALMDSMFLLVGYKKNTSECDNLSVTMSLNLYQNIPNSSMAALSTMLGYGTSRGEVWDRWLGYWQPHSGKKDCMLGYDASFHKEGKMTLGSQKYAF